ncbi:MAG: rhomboid family intramembrane serine protease [Rhizobacter sp.]|nr:rhomboid family intramembrane serine protease [Rhizobacter sp.]
MRYSIAVCRDPERCAGPVTRGSRAWVGVTLLLSACVLLGWPLTHASALDLPADALDWQPALAFSQPWRAFTAVFVHYSVAHLIGNLAGVALAGAFGVVALVSTRMAWAWLAAWPLTHWGLLGKPELTHYGGLSGVVHAGVAIVIVYVLATGTRAQRLVGSAVLAGFCGKLVSESPWGAALRHPAGWDIAVAPIAHATGSFAGALCAGIMLLLPLRKSKLGNHD